MFRKFGGHWEQALINRFTSGQKPSRACRSSPAGQTASHSPFWYADNVENIGAVSVSIAFGAADQEARKCVLHVLQLSHSDFSRCPKTQLHAGSSSRAAISLPSDSSLWRCSFSPRPAQPSPSPTAAPSLAPSSMPPARPLKVPPSPPRTPQRVPSTRLRLARPAAIACTTCASAFTEFLSPRPALRQWR